MITTKLSAVVMSEEDYISYIYKKCNIFVPFTTFRYMYFDIMIIHFGIKSTVYITLGTASKNQPRQL